MTTATTTVGAYLASRLVDVGLRHYFAVPGDYNLVLLDRLLENEQLQMISCCNELNAGYAADGYCRASGGPSAVVVTYSVGGLSALNAVAGAYAEDLPVIAISGGPNTNSGPENEFLHHTLGEVDYDYQRALFERVTVATAILTHPADAPAQIDRVLETALLQRKPVYIEVPSNVAAATTSAPRERTFHTHRTSDPAALEAAVSDLAARLDAAEKPVLLAGVKLRPADALGAFGELVDASGYAVASMPNAKGFVRESHPAFMGTYWGPVSDVGCSEIVEAGDACLVAGGTWTDYTTCGHQLGLVEAHVLKVNQDTVEVPGATYTNVMLRDVLGALAARVQKNGNALVAYERIRPDPPAPVAGGDGPLTVRQLFAQVGELLDDRSLLLVETGDSWFNGMDVRLPDGAGFEIQMQYGSIGWSVGATLGAALGGARRVIACIGDGSFQLTAQELSTMIRYGVNPIVFLINNGGYTIEVEIHDGPYNVIKNWRYAGLVDVFNADDGQGWSAQASTADELRAAIETARGNTGLSFIEVVIDRDDCNRNLLRWGNRVAKNNGRPPRSG